MNIYNQSAEVTSYLKQLRAEGRQYGFVPTMGALHRGHLSLIDRAKKENDLVVCSIFVNPAQFNDPKDFDLYPKTIETDISQLENAGCEVLFYPDTSQIYPAGSASGERYDIGRLEFILEGKYRPGHFQGVCKVMRRLMNIIQPDRLYLGQKDFQQCLVIQKLLSLMHLKARIVTCPTLREADGLAMSSRNTRLTAEQREKAPGIFKALCYIRDHVRRGTLNQVKEDAVEILLRHGFSVDYVEISSTKEFSPMQEWDGRIEIIALIAARMGEVRLIDNMVLQPHVAPKEAI